MITRENYEAVYLDYLEGNCSPELTSELVLFLEANPDLKVDDDMLPVLEMEQVGMSEFDKLLLKKSDEKAIVITAENVDYYFVAQTERQLTLAEQQALATWLKANPAFVTEQALHQQTTLQADQSLVFPNKQALKKEVAIVPLWTRSLSIAASITLLVGLGWWVSTTGPDNNLGNTSGPRANNLPVKPRKTIDPTQEKDPQTFTVQPQQQNGQVNKQMTSPSKKDIVVPVPLPESPMQDMAHENAPSAPSNRGNDGIILPEQPIVPQLATVIEPKITNKEDHSTFAWNNPIAPITEGLSARLNTPIDFRKQKPTQQEAGGFYLKIGKFELSHKRGGRR